MSSSETENNNQAEKILTSQDIQQNINLFEGRGIPDWWIVNTKASTLEQTRKDYLKLNFPRGNPLRKVLMALAWSFPMPQITPAETPGPKTGTVVTRQKKKPGVKKPAQTDKRKIEIEAKIKELWERMTWEGEKNFPAALSWWRPFAFVTGGTFIKLPTTKIDGKEVVIPERMPGEYTKILLDKARIKVIAGFQFRYWVQLDGFYEDDPKGTFQVQETITKDAWVVDKSPEFENGKTDKLSFGFIPVSHMQWEERTLHPRGLPLMERLKEKALHLYSVMMDRREAGKFAGSKMFVRINAKGTLPTNRSGSVVDIQDASPVKKADMKSLDVNTDDTMLRNEYLDAYRELYEEAFQPFPLDENANAGSPQSGKALRHASKNELRYKEVFCQTEGRFIIDLFAKALTMEGFPITAAELRCDYDLGIEPEPAERRADASLYFQEGFPEEGLRSMGKEEDEIEEMMTEREEAQAASMLTDNGMQPKLDEKGNPIEKKGNIPLVKATPLEQDATKKPVSGAAV